MVVRRLRNGPDLWAALLEDLVPIFGGDTIVAGGAVRDFMLGLEPKDIDIWVNERDLVGMQHKMRRLHEDQYLRWNWYLKEMEDGDPDYNGSIGDNLLIWEGEAVYKPQVGEGAVHMAINVIACPEHVDGIEAVVDRFDMDICQWWFSGGMIHQTPAALAALDNRTATVIRGHDHSRADRRFANFNARNPGVLKYVNPFQGDLFE
ncbi:tRNA nucleotidyltransferase [Caulobacter phage Percy]|uniref:tRNA nucleotidyltransferase n=1 Tax=Caulobacter phage Percy TaxID=1701809 RepID=A0A0M4RBU1_9CAUD|nr:nucleotidyltransferase [Caulobacter phage Percy]ALF01647.1 tRNA nucleotidyltransferase [Caulobacter phage Percy]